jgi:hypothetical protein
LLRKRLSHADTVTCTQVTQVTYHTLHHNQWSRGRQCFVRRFDWASASLESLSLDIDS